MHRIRPASGGACRRRRRRRCAQPCGPVRVRGAPPRTRTSRFCSKFVPAAVFKLARAHECAPGNKGEGRPPMRTRRIRLDNNTGTSPRERDSGAPMGCRGARGQRTPDAAHAGMCHIQFNAAGPRTEQGDAPHGGGGGRPWASWQAACPRLERGGLQRRHARRNKAGRRNPAAPGVSGAVAVAPGGGARPIN